jgi:hypothetical protein
VHRPAIVRSLLEALRREDAPAAALVPEYPLRLQPRWGWGSPPLASIAERLASSEQDYANAVRDIAAMRDWAAKIPRTAPGPGEPAWDNDYWGTLDALMQCAALRARNPERYIEIGSGWSTLFARRAITDFGLRTRIISIDPAPRADVDAVCDEVVREPLEEVDVALFEQLGGGDVLLFDGSHTALMNSDATVFFLEVVPRIRPGVLVGIDDIFLPSDYHETWALRVYGEQYLLAAFLLGGAEGWRIRFPAWWVVEHSALGLRLAELWPLVENRFGRYATSFWMERQ